MTSSFDFSLMVFLPVRRDQTQVFRYTTPNFLGDAGKSGSGAQEWRYQEASNMKMTRITSLWISAVFGLMILGCGCGGGSKDGSSNEGTGGGTALKGRELPTEPGNSAEGDTIKIGMIASLNGEQQPWGVDSQKGGQLAVDEFNAAGGVNGKKVELIVEDTNSKPEQSKTATEKLVGEDKVLAVVGEVSSGNTLPAAKVCQEVGVPIVAVGATRIDVTQQGGAVFRACFTDDFQGAAMAKFA